MLRALRNAFPGNKWRHQMPIGPYFADVACFAKRLVIELDGGQHTPEGDAARTRFIHAQGYRLLRFWNNDALANTAAVIDQIAAVLSPSPSQAVGLGPSLSHGRGDDRPE